MRFQRKGNDISSPFITANDQAKEYVGVGLGINIYLYSAFFMHSL
jgi:hypothetical protein